MALPVTVSGNTLINLSFGRLGPWLSGGNVYFLSIFNTTTDRICMFKATDPTSSFSEMDSSNRPISGSTNVISVSGVQVGTDIHVVMHGRTTGSNSRLLYARFSMSSDTWTNTGTLIQSASTISTAFGEMQGCDIALLSGGTIRVVAQSTTNKDMGTNYSQLAHYSSTDNGSTWSSPTVVSNSTTTNWGSPRIVNPPNNSDQCIIFMNSEGTLSRYRGLSSGGTLRTMRSIGAINTVIHNFAPAIGYLRSSVSRAGILRIDTLSTTKSTSPWTMNAFTDDSIATFDSGDISQNEPRSQNNASVAAMVANSSGVEHYLFVEVSDGDIKYINDQGTSTYTTVVTEFVGDVTHISANIYDRGGGDVLAYVMRDGSDTKYNERGLGPVVTRRVLPVVSNYAIMRAALHLPDR